MQLIPLTGTETILFIEEFIYNLFLMQLIPLTGTETQSPQIVRKGAWSEGFVLYLNIVESTPDFTPGCPIKITYTFYLPAASITGYSILVSGSGFAADSLYSPSAVPLRQFFRRPHPRSDILESIRFTV